jgi:calcium permeable stress-gated cation channel
MLIEWTSDRKRARPLPTGPWKWLPAVAVIPPEDVVRSVFSLSVLCIRLSYVPQIHKNGLDAYMLLRFLRLMIIIFGTFTLVTWAVLIPINVVGVNGQSDGLSKLSWGK